MGQRLVAACNLWCCSELPEKITSSGPSILDSIVIVRLCLRSSGLALDQYKLLFSTAESGLILPA